MLSCAGAYVCGAAGSNECPAGSVRIETEAVCRTAALAAGKTLTAASAFVETLSTYPRGCYYYTSTNAAYFNRDAVGAGFYTAQLLCAAMTTGAPPHGNDARARTQAHTHTHTHTPTHPHTHTHTYIFIYICIYVYI